MIGTMKRVPGEDHTSTLDTVNDLGFVNQSQGEFQEAESMYL